MPIQTQKKRGFPKRISREGWKAQFTRYTNNCTREQNKAKRIVKAALVSYDPFGVAIAQGQTSAKGVITFIREILDRKGIVQLED